MARKIPRRRRGSSCRSHIFLYFFRLGGAGLVGPGRAPVTRGSGAPWRKPAIGSRLACAAQPWFEKPALLYWMIAAAAFRAGLGPDLAPRLPVALPRERHSWHSTGGLSTAHSVAARPSCATLILGSSVAWIGIQPGGE